MERKLKTRHEISGIEDYTINKTLNYLLNNTSNSDYFKMSYLMGGKHLYESEFDVEHLFEYVNTTELDSNNN